MDLATSRREDRAQEEAEFAVDDDPGLSSQRATESFGNEQRRLKSDTGCLAFPPTTVTHLRSRFPGNLPEAHKTIDIMFPRKLNWFPWKQ
jgi:hypothetical protein